MKEPSQGTFVKVSQSVKTQPLPPTTQLEDHQELIFNIRKLQQIEKLEKSHLQWKKQGINLLIFFLLALLNMVRGSKENPSLFGVEVCSWQDWTSLVVYIALCVALSVYSVKVVQDEQDLKVKYGAGLASSDIELRGGTLIKLISFSFIGGWVSGALGLGGGSIFNPLLLSMGCNPIVASATGMYMIIFSTGASTITYVFADMLDITYGLWIGSFCILGTMLGMFLLQKLMKKLRRQSPLVILLSFILGISAVAVPLFGYQQVENEADFFEFGSICD